MSAEYLGFMALVALALTYLALVALWPATRSGRPFAREAPLASLELAISEAVDRNQYGMDIVPTETLRRMVLLAPGTFESGVENIRLLHRQGIAVSLDLGNLDGPDARRLVDFCDGMASVSNAWLLQVAASTMVLIPEGT